MQVTINGAQRSFDRALTIRELIDELGLNAETVAVERNRAIVKRDLFPSEQIESGDQIEIVEFVGGG